MWLVFQDKANRKALVRQQGIDAFFLHRLSDYSLSYLAFREGIARQQSRRGNAQQYLHGGVVTQIGNARQQSVKRESVRIQARRIEGNGNLGDHARLTPIVPRRGNQELGMVPQYCPKEVKNE